MVMRQAGNQRSCYRVERTFAETGICACHRKRKAFCSERLLFLYGLAGTAGKISPYPAPDVQGTVKGADKRRVRTSDNHGAEGREGASDASDGNYLRHGNPGERAALYHGGGGEGRARGGGFERENTCHITAG